MGASPEITSKHSFIYFSSVDLAVDWLNDRLYWVDAELRLIEEYDISTGSRKFVASTGSAATSRPAAMSLYPYPNYG